MDFHGPAQLALTRINPNSLHGIISKFKGLKWWQLISFRPSPFPKVRTSWLWSIALSSFGIFISLCLSFCLSLAILLFVTVSFCLSHPVSLVLFLSFRFHLSVSQFYFSLSRSFLHNSIVLSLSFYLSLVYLLFCLSSFVSLLLARPLGNSVFHSLSLSVSPSVCLSVCLYVSVTTMAPIKLEWLGCPIIGLFFPLIVTTTAKNSAILNETDNLLCQPWWSETQY